MKVNRERELIANVQGGCVSNCLYDFAMDWQPLIAAGIALYAAQKTVQTMKSDIDASDRRHRDDRSKKFRARRATLSNDLAIISAHVSEISRILHTYMPENINELPDEAFSSSKAALTYQSVKFPSHPFDTIKSLGDAIESCDNDIVASWLEKIIIEMQIVWSQQDLIKNWSSGKPYLSSRLILQCACIYALCDNLLIFCRDVTHSLPPRLKWEAVSHALNYWQLYNGQVKERFEYEMRNRSVPGMSEPLNIK